MSQDSTQHELTEEELRELIPQLQQLTDKYKRAERVQKALFDISELASSVSHLNRLYSAIHEIIADFMNADNFFVAFTNPTVTLSISLTSLTNSTNKPFASSPLNR